MSDQVKTSLMQLSESVRVAAHLQHIEGNPLNADDVALFEMLEREGWTHEQCLAYLRKHVRSDKFAPAAE